VQVHTQALPDNGRYQQDNFMTTISFADGSLGTVTYVANGDKAFSKEMIEVFGGGLSARLDDFRSLTVRHNNTRINRKARLRQDKGHSAEWDQWATYLIDGRANPMPFNDIVKTMDVTFAAAMSLREGTPVTLQIG
jgi:predicted dehydrogenase